MSAMSAMQLVYPFDCELRSPSLLGEAGSSLARMAALGLPIAPGFTIATSAWPLWSETRGRLPGVLKAEIDAATAALGLEIDRQFDDPDRPRLVSIRAGGAVSIPGVTDAVLNLGLSDPRFPGRGRDQLDGAIVALWRSWDSPRARRYRRERGIAEDLGTAITVQTMVFGDLDDRSGTGAALTRDPTTGRPGIYGYFLRGASGEAGGAGLAAPEPIEAAGRDMPRGFAELPEALGVLETYYRDMCDVEFTVESGRLWILQSRVGQRSGPAAVRIATDMVDEGLIDIQTAIRRIPLSALEQLQAPVAARGRHLDLVAQGMLVPPQPDERVARLLSWCDERARAPVLACAPEGYARVSTVEQAETAGDRVLVDVPWEGNAPAELLVSVCQILLERDPPPRLALAVPENLRGGDLRPPRGPWDAIVAQPRTAWAARLLSARIDSQRAPSLPQSPTTARI
jgi:phosphoenolpyruvate synthase/pyruvate phosphate dikinase